MRDRPRVDILNINFFDWNGERAFTGGAERYVLDLARLLAAFGMRPRLLQNAHRAFERRFAGIEVLGVPATDKFDMSAMSAAFGAPTRDAALVIASPLELASQLGAGPPVIGINHGIWWDLPGYAATHPELAHRDSLRAALHAVTACVAVDTNFINWLRASGDNPPHVEYIPNYVDLERFRAQPKDFDAPRLTVLFPRRLCQERGFHETLRAFDMLLAEGVPCDLRLCGGGAVAEEDRARAFVAKHPGHVHWSEARPEDMPDVYATSHVVVVPTVFSEGTSLACLEAMATNNGVVATHVGGLPNLVLDEVNGLLIKPGAEALAAALRRLARDRNLLARMAGRAQEVAATFSLERWQRRWSALLAGALPALRPAIDAWRAAQPQEGLPVAVLSTVTDTAESSARLQIGVAEAEVRARNALSERDGAYRAALVATFDRDAARRAERDARAELDAMASREAAACEQRDHARALAAGAESLLAEARARARAVGDELEHARAQLARSEARQAALLASRGNRLLQKLDPRGRYLLPPVEPAADPPRGVAAADGTGAQESSVVVEPVPVSPASNAAGSGPAGPERSVTDSRMHGMRAECCGLVSGLVSVVLPVYNQASLVGSAIRSVLAQTYSHFELIIVDDGSTDALDPVLAEFQGDPRVRVVSQVNQRLPQALTNGFAAARGEFWTWTSADNLMGAMQLERMVARLADDPALAMVYADYWVIDDRGNPLADPHWRAHNRPDPTSNVVRLPRTVERLNAVPDNFIGPCFLYRGWIGRVLGPYERHQGVEDYDYWMRINALFTIAHLGTDDVLYWYRVHGNTLTARSGEERIPQKIEALMAIERERAAWYRLPLKRFVDPALVEWEATHPLTGARDDLDAASGPHALDFGPAIAITAADSLPDLVPSLATGDALPLVVVVPPGATISEAALPVLQRPRVLVVVADPEDASRIGTLTAAPMIDGTSPLLDMALGAFARNASYIARAAR